MLRFLKLQDNLQSYISMLHVLHSGCHVLVFCIVNYQ